MIKRISILCLLVILIMGAYAQEGKHVWNKPNYDEYPFHFGFAVGYNQMNFRIIPREELLTSFDTVYGVENRPRPGFNIHMVGNLRLGENFDLRFIPGLAFGQRDLNYTRVNTVQSDTVLENHLMQIESTFLSFPLYLKYRAKRLNNWRPYLLFGGNYAFDLEARKKIKEEERPKIRLMQQDFYLEAGVGIDYYFPFFKLATELRFSFGMMNVIKDDNTEYTRFYDRLNSRMFTLLIFVE
ncbi:MAG TPA: porin family protein [Salinivirga sp.]|uniref:type IX secretion/gliding motility protein PorT/SprT n=1 Tax=Salinivirga sp. TaxID=1970192 RepID=UPI002B468CA9|nr:porin family protein [Salinivirga sp.]HKK58508.1 porin family protein [Salinivirga sp.]